MTIASQDWPQGVGEQRPHDSYIQPLPITSGNEKQWMQDASIRSFLKHISLHINHGKGLIKVWCGPGPANHARPEKT